MATSVIGQLSAILELNTAQFSAGVDRAQKRMQMFRRSMNQLGRQLQLPLTIASGVMVKAAADLESGMIGVQKTTGLADKEIQKLKRGIVDFSAQNAVAINSLQETAKVAGQMGIEGSGAILEFTEAFAKLEQASDRTVQGELGAQTFARFLDLTGSGIEAAEEMASAMVELGNTSKTTEGAILATANEVAKGTVQFQLGAANILGLATALDEAGVQSEVARTSLQSFFTEVDKAVKSGSENLDTFARVVGTTTDNIKDLLKNDPTELLLSFTEGLADMSSRGEDTATILDDLGLGAKRYSLILNVLAERNDQVREKVEAANEAQRKNVALNRENEAAQRGLWSSLTRVWNAVTGLSDAMGEGGLLDGLTGVADGTRDLLVELTEATRQLNDTEQAAIDFGDTNIELASYLADVIARIVDVYRTGFGVISRSFQALRKTLGAGGAQILALIQGRFDDIIRIGEAWSEDMSALFSETLDINTSAFGDALDEIREKIGMRGLSKDMETLADSLKRNIPMLNGIARSAPPAADGLEELGEDSRAAEIAQQRLASQIEAMADRLQAAIPIIGETRSELEAYADSSLEAAIQVQQMESQMTALFDRMTRNMPLIGEGEQKMESFWRTTDEIARDTIRGVRDGWVGFFEDVFHGKGISSIKDFLDKVKDLFLRVIAEIAAAWTASKIFGGDFSIGGIKIGGGGGGLNIGLGIGGAKDIASKVGGFLGIGGGGSAGISGASVVGTSPVAAGGAQSASALASAAVPAAVLAFPFVMDKIMGEGQVDRMFAKFRGFSSAGPLGLQVGTGGNTGFAGGPMAGFAREFARGQGFTAASNFDDSLTAISGLGDLEDLAAVLEDAQIGFEMLKKAAAETFGSGMKDAARMGQALQDGVVDRAERAALGLENIGVRLEHAKTGMVSLGDITTTQFEAITEAVRSGEIRLDALRGEVELNQSEIKILGEQGLTAAELIANGFDVAALSASNSLRRLRAEGVSAFGDIQGAANSAANAASGVGGGGGGGRTGPGPGSRVEDSLQSIDRNIRQIRRNSGGGL